MKNLVRRNALHALALALMLVLLSACGQANNTTIAEVRAPVVGDGFTERTIALISNVDDAPSELAVRFYDEAPHVPYLGLSTYKELVFGDKTTVEAKGAQATLTASEGGTLVVDANEDKVFSNNLAAFRTYLEPQKQAGAPNGFLDLGTPFVRVGSLTYEGEAQPVTLDYGAYNIDLHVDERDAYLPLACESDLLAVPSSAALFYNGTNLYLTNCYLDSVLELDPDYYEHLENDHERPQDMVDFTYNNLCFLMDNLAGNTQSDMLGPLMAQVGFDKALDHDEATRKTRDLLKSNDFYEFLLGTDYLTTLTYNGHSDLTDYTLLLDSAFTDSEFMNDDSVYDTLYETDLTSTHEQRADGYDDISIVEQRAELLGEDPPSYREAGNTAVITLDSFLYYDADEWDEYYNGDAEMPTDDLVGTLVSGLRQAKENPEITYVVFDVSCNRGGFNDLLAITEALVLKESQLRLYDQLNQQFSVVHYEADSLFDGSFNTTAFAEDTNFTYGVLASRRTFSCGHAFAEHCRNKGIPIIGEPSHGGEYLVVPAFYPEGLCGHISAGTMMMVDDQGLGNEEGEPVDVELVTTDEDGSRDYSDFYNVEKLDEVMKSLDNKS